MAVFTIPTVCLRHIRFISLAQFIYETLFHTLSYDPSKNSQHQTYRGADKSLALPTSRYILLDGENISFDASLIIYINSTNIPRIMIINRIYENKNLLSLQLVSFLVGLRIYQHPCTIIAVYISEAEKYFQGEWGKKYSRESKRCFPDLHNVLQVPLDRLSSTFICSLKSFSILTRSSN